MLRALCVLVLVSACGSVSPARDVDAGGSGGGAAGAAATAGAGGTGGAGGTSAAGAGGIIGAAGVSGQSGAGGAPACLPYNAPGFAYNPSCGDGGTTSAAGCHANCELAGAHYVGCAEDPRVDGGAVECHASCSECP